MFSFGSLTQTPADLLVALFLGLICALIGNYIWSKKRPISKRLRPYRYFICKGVILIIFVPLLWALIANVAIPKATLMINNGDTVSAVFVATGLSFFVGLLIKPLFEMAYDMTLMLKPRK